MFSCRVWHRQGQGEATALLLPQAALLPDSQRDASGLMLHCSRGAAQAEDGGVEEKKGCCSGVKAAICVWKIPWLNPSLVPDSSPLPAEQHLLACCNLLLETL